MNKNWIGNALEMNRKWIRIAYEEEMNMNLNKKWKGDGKDMNTKWFAIQAPNCIY